MGCPSSGARNAVWELVSKMATFDGVEDFQVGWVHDVFLALGPG